MQCLNSISGYNAQHIELAIQYESVTFEQVHHHVLHLFPIQPMNVLDIGAGSGRDAAGFSALGHRVVAAEPAQLLREEGQRIHALHSIDWVDDSLPHLRGLVQQDEKFELIMITAVWMHLDILERQTAMANVATLLQDGGLCIMMVRHGPVPEGRRMFEVTNDETIRLAHDKGLTFIDSMVTPDSLGRPDVSWHTLVFKKENSFNTLLQNSVK